MDGMKVMNEADAIRNLANLQAKMKPCPFCGGRPEVVATHPDTDWVECGCGAQGPGKKDGPGGYRTAARRAIQAWNKRSNS